MEKVLAAAAMKAERSMGTEHRPGQRGAQGPFMAKDGAHTACGMPSAEVGQILAEAATAAHEQKHQVSSAFLVHHKVSEVRLQALDFTDPLLDDATGEHQGWAHSLYCTYKSHTFQVKYRECARPALVSTQRRGHLDLYQPSFTDEM
jgi:hypothetical protein